MAAKIANSGADSVKAQREKILAHKNTDYSILAIGTKLAETRIMSLMLSKIFSQCTKWYTSAKRTKLSETRIACVDATGFLSDVYKVVHERKTHKTLGNSDSVRRCDGIFKRRVQSGTRAQKFLADTR